MAESVIKLPVGLRITYTSSVLPSGQNTFHDMAVGTILVFYRNGSGIIICGSGGQYLSVGLSGITVESYTTGGDLVVNRSNSYTGNVIVYSP